jgi:hypothetical protein
MGNSNSKVVLRGCYLPLIPSFVCSATQRTPWAFAFLEVQQ